MEVNLVKRIGFIILAGCLLCLLVMPALAQEEVLPVVRITYAADAVLSQEEDVEAQVTLVYAGQETALNARLRLNDATLDIVEATLPQKSLRIDSDDVRLSCITMAATRSIPRWSARCAAT